MQVHAVSGYLLYWHGQFCQETYRARVDGCVYLCLWDFAFCFCKVINMVQMWMQVMVGAGVMRWNDTANSHV